MLLLRNLKLLTWIVIVKQTQNSLHDRPTMFDTHSIVHDITGSPTNKVILSWSEPNCHSISIPSWHRIETFPSPIRRISLPAEARWTWLNWDAESARWSDGLESSCRSTFGCGSSVLTFTKLHESLTLSRGSRGLRAAGPTGQPYPGYASDCAALPITSWLYRAKCRADYGVICDFLVITLLLQ